MGSVSFLPRLRLHRSWFDNIQSYVYGFQLCAEDIEIELTGLELWVKQWAEAGGGELPKYLTVYLILPFSTLLGVGGFIW